MSEHAPLFITFERLQGLGWPYSRTHTKRLEDQGLFPKRIKLMGDHRCNKVVWEYEAVLKVLSQHLKRAA
jgi:hypothetical protein